jgi:hypothetical protein
MKTTCNGHSEKMRLLFGREGEDLRNVIEEM